MQRGRRVIWGGLALAGAVLVLLVARRGRPLAVDVAPVLEQDLRVTVQEAGTTRIRGGAEVSAPATGRWVPSRLQAGDSVRTGQLLGVLYPAPMDAVAQEQANARVGAAEAAVREAEAAAVAATVAREEAASTVRRMESLRAVGGVSDQALEQARTALAARQGEQDGARLRVQAAQYEARSARAAAAPAGGTRGALRIASPIPGRVLRVHAEFERVVPAGTPLLDVGDPANLEVVVPLLTADAARVARGAEVVLRTGGAGDSIAAVVSRVEPSAFTKLSALGVEEQRVNAIISIPSPDARLGDRYRVEATITTRHLPSATVVPLGALLRDGDGWAVYVLDGDRVRRRAVTIGERSETLAEVRSGLSAGERVVLYPGEAIADGTRVRPGG
jgi:HlyD family secretion protein